MVLLGSTACETLVNNVSLRSKPAPLVKNLKPKALLSYSSLGGVGCVVFGCVVLC